MRFPAWSSSPVTHCGLLLEEPPVDAVSVDGILSAAACKDISVSGSQQDDGDGFAPSVAPHSDEEEPEQQSESLLFIVNPLATGHRFSSSC
jgi:hypothetical protein